MTRARYVVVTGGVLSGVGKGTVSAAVAEMLDKRGVAVTHLRFDPRLNLGEANPEDGVKVVSAGEIWETVLLRERKGEYLGETVQIVPHITDEIKARIRNMTAEIPGGGDTDTMQTGEAAGAATVVVEVGGVVGDMESQVFLEAVRQWRNEQEEELRREGAGDSRVVHVHVSWVPFLKAAEELKSKPTQHSVAELSSRGLHPDVIVLRAEREVGESIRAKVAMFCDVPQDAVVEAVDMSDPAQITAQLEKEGLGEAVARKLGVDTTRVTENTTP